jgi:glycosyltransferase involved in cell wall biosynthesis
LRILTISHFFESHGGGIERVAGELNRQFGRLGAIAVWAASNSDPPPGGEIEVVPLSCINPTEKLTGLPMPIPGFRGICALAREVRRSDAVVIHDALYATSVLAMLIAKATGKRAILIQHIAGIPFASRIMRRIMSIANGLITRPMLGAADVRVFVSDTVRKDLLGHYGRSSELLFNGVNGSIFFRSEDPKTLSSSARQILFVGRYVEKKGLTVLRALAALRADLSFLLVGSGPIRPADWGLANVRDLGVLDQSHLAKLYRSTDVLLLPSVGEGYPLVIQEAMACGLPVVCGAPSNRADPDAARWLRGVTIDLSEPSESAKRCSDAIDSIELSETDRAEMARYALRRYDWSAMARRLVELAQLPQGPVTS